MLDLEIDIEEPGVVIRDRPVTEAREISQPDYVVQEIRPKKEILEICKPGPKGEDGGATPGTGDKNYHHNQSIPSMNVTVNHGLAKIPSVTVKDSVGNLIEASVTFIDNNHVNIQLSALFAWTADFN